MKQNYTHTYPNLIQRMQKLLNSNVHARISSSIYPFDENF